MARDSDRARWRGAWFDADATPPTFAAKRFIPLAQAIVGDGGQLVRIDDAFMTRTRAKGAVDTLAWDIAWGPGRDAHAEVPTWLPAPTHAKTIAYDADATGTVTDRAQAFDSLRSSGGSPGSSRIAFARPSS